MKPEDQIDPDHDEKRGILRIVGAACLIVGLLFAIIGIASFFTTFGSGGGVPRHFWCFFIGLPLVWLGFVISSAGFAGAAARYLAGESAPVARDTTNYMAEETRKGVRTFASAMGEGFASGVGATKPFSILCHQCHQLNDSDSKFCKGCGATLPKIKYCITCHATNDPDAKFCDQCGRGLG